METKIEKLPKSTYKITITIPKETVNQTRERIIEEAVKTAKVEGFREGKAPKEIVEKRLDEKNIRGEIINRLLPDAYSQAVKEHHVNPITQPKLKIEKFELNQDLVFEAAVVEKPEVKIGDYKKELLKLKDARAGKIIYDASGKPIKSSSGKDEQAKKINDEDILRALLDISEVEISDILIENEVTNMLSRLLDQTARLGLTVEEYLTSTNKTPQMLREEYKKAAAHNLKAEFLLSELIKKENIDASEEEIKETIRATPDEKTRKELEKEENKWYIESIIRKRKLIQKFLDILEGGKS